MLGLGKERKKEMKRSRLRGEADSPVGKEVKEMTSGQLVSGGCHINDDGDLEIQESSTCSLHGGVFATTAIVQHRRENYKHW